jgi:hypothetical protein
MAQKIAEYQETPKGDQQCSNCNLFQEPNACTLVDGEISPKGWCKFWVKKAGKPEGFRNLMRSDAVPRGNRVARLVRASVKDA